MGESVYSSNPSPALSTNFVSKIFFCWLNPLLTRGRQKPLTTDDLFDVCPQESSRTLGDDLEREWNKQVERGGSGGTSKASLLVALMHVFGLRYMMLGAIIFVEEAVRFSQPLLLGQLIQYFIAGHDMERWEAYVYALGVALCAIIIAVAHHPYFFGVVRLGLQIKVACCSLMYRKILRLSLSATESTSTGKMTNLMTSDVNCFDMAVMYFHFLLIGPLEILAVAVILWFEIGPSVFAGFGVLFFFIWLQKYLGSLSVRLRKKIAECTDERLKKLTDTIAGMRLVKMYCWEEAFGDQIEKHRKSEIRRILTRCRILGFFSFVMTLDAVLYLLPVLIVFVVCGYPLRAAALYKTVLCFTALNRNINRFTARAVQACGEVKTSAKRIQEFLLLDEFGNGQSNIQQNPSATPHAGSVTVEKLTLKLKRDQQENTLEDISFSTTGGQLLAVVGPVGVGKSSLLMAILGERPISSGQVCVNGNMAYAAQQAWVFPGTLRDNITFGLPFDQQQFDRVIDASALRSDLEAMRYGEHTLTGERGVTLSGGQKARVGLARALYADADIYLLDDPFSAVDVTVGGMIFDRCIQGMLREKTRILATHHRQYLKSQHLVLDLKEKTVKAVQAHDCETSSAGHDTARDGGKSDMLQCPEQVSQHAQAADRPSTKTSPAVLNATSQRIQRPQEEERKTGTVGWGVYLSYFRAGAGVFPLLLLIVLNVVTQGAFIASDWWLATWSSAVEDRVAATEQQQLNLSHTAHHTNGTLPVVDSHRNFYIFLGIIVVALISGVLRAMLFYGVAVNAAQNLHDRMLQTVLRCPVQFFDQQGVGRIMNRFSKDIGQLDYVLPDTLFGLVQCSLLTVSLVLMVGALNPWVFIPTIPLVMLFLYLRTYNLSTSRSLKRLEATCRSPVISHMGVTLEGLTTIRAFNMEEKWRDQFEAHLDQHSAAYFLFKAADRWLGIRLDSLCALFVTAVAFCSVMAAGALDPGLVGLSITYSMTLMGLFQWTVRQSAEAENQMISVERVLEYTKLPVEAPLLSTEDHRPPTAWPNTGAITAAKLHLQYAHDSPVLKDLSFSIDGNNKVGIVGKTGAGKSSLFTCLLRLVEPTGQLCIDGIDVTHLGLHDLRRIFTVVPQDPTLFRGTLRENLDPFNRHDDTELWQALAETQLKTTVSSLPEGLDSHVAELGVNLSVGERQLLCLARAILHNSRILLIDEATANVDARTGELIQKTIREKFHHCTVLTIAHRLDAIMDSDTIMVLADGELKEMGHAHDLLQTDSGVFRRMVQETDPTESQRLARLAAKSYKTREKTASPRPGAVDGTAPEQGSQLSGRESSSDSPGPDGATARDHDEHADDPSERDALIVPGTADVVHI